MVPNESKHQCFLQVFYRMRCVSRMSFIGIGPSKLDINGGGEIGGDGLRGYEFVSATKILPPTLNYYY